MYVIYHIDNNNCKIHDDNIIIILFIFFLFCLLLQKESIMIKQKKKVLENRSKLVWVVTNQYKMVPFS